MFLGAWKLMIKATYHTKSLRRIEVSCLKIKYFNFWLLCLFVQEIVFTVINLKCFWSKSLVSVATQGHFTTHFIQFIIVRTLEKLRKKNIWNKSALTLISFNRFEIFTGLGFQNISKSIRCRGNNIICWLTQDSHLLDNVRINCIASFHTE